VAIPKVTREQFDKAMEAVWTEIEYRNNLERRTEEDECKDIAGFCTLLRHMLHKCEQDWYSWKASEQPDGQMQVTECLHWMRKLASGAVIAMVYNGSLNRRTFKTNEKTS